MKFCVDCSLDTDRGKEQKVSSTDSGTCTTAHVFVDVKFIYGV